MEFFNLPVTNAYNNLTAVSIRIGTPSSKGVKSVLVNAHFDSVFGTTGRAHQASGLSPVSCLCNHKEMPVVTCMGGPSPSDTSHKMQRVMRYLASDQLIQATPSEVP